MRIWIAGPRMLGGLIRPGVSFAVPARPTPRGVVEACQPTPNLDRLDNFALILLEIAIALFLFVFGLGLFGIAYALIR